MSTKDLQPIAPPLIAPEIGHEEIQRNILNTWQQGRLPHAFLFHGPEGSGKDALAIALARLLNCGNRGGQMDETASQFIKIGKLEHPDVRFILPTPAESNQKKDEVLEALQEKAANPYRRVIFAGKNIFIGIDTIRELKQEAGFKLYEGRKKVFILSEVDRMRPEAANALLKLLEEPPANLMLILTTANIYKILPTIKSRCQLIRFPRLSGEQMEQIVEKYVPSVDKQTLPLIIRLSGFNLKRTFDFLEKDVLNIRDQAIDFLRKAVRIHRAQELFAIIEPIAAKKDREEARLLLWFLLLWFQDILYLQKKVVDEQTLLNVDQIDTLKKFLSFTPGADIAAIVWEIESALQDLHDPRNFNPLLILTNLAIKLSRKIS